MQYIELKGMADLSKDLTAASSIPLILSILAKGENYGYEIIRQVGLLSDGRIQWTDGMLYPVLHKLEQRGLIQSDWRLADDTGRKRKYYRLTDKGLAQMGTEKAQWSLVYVTMLKLWAG